MYGLWLFKELRTEYGHCKVEVFRKGYTASAVEIGGFVGNSLNLALENLDTITAPIGKSVCSFSIYDTEQVEYDDLFTPDATAYKVVISTKVDGGEYNTRWSGYVTPDFFAENLSFRTPISISARDNIGYLNDVDFDLDTATITVRELIQAAFNRIAEDYPMSLSFVTQKQTAEGILAIDATISTYLLREMSWYEALETILHDLGLQMRWVDNNTIAVLDISQLGENFGLQRFNFVERSGYREILPAWREFAQEQSYGVLDNFFKGHIDGENKLEYAANSAINSNILLYQPKSITQWSRQGEVYFLNFYNSYNAEIDDDKQDAIFITGVAPSATNADVLGKKMVYSQAVTEVDKQIKMTFSLNDTLRTPLASQYSRGERNTLYLPYSQSSGNQMLKTPHPYQLKYRFNIFLRANDGTNYVMREDWVEEAALNEQPFIEFLTDKLQTVDTGVTDGQGNHRFAYTGYNNSKEYSITIGSIPKAGTLEFVVYPWTFEQDAYPSVRDAATYQRGAKISDIEFSVQVGKTGVETKTQVGVLHNIAEKANYSFGQVPQREGDIITYAGGLFKSDTITALQGFKRNVDSTTYPLLELVGREIIHFNKKNYNKLSGTIKNLAKEPLRFDRMFIYKGKNYLPFACSLDVISNTMNITTMQEVEPYTTHSFVEIKSELVTGGGATISGGNNTALQYSAEVGNAKRISELNNASESEKKESYIVIDNANWNESKKVPLSEMEGLDEAQVEAYLTENKYAKQSWVKGITDDLETDIAKRVLIEDFDKLQEAVDLNYANLNKATTRISTLEGYFSNGVANNAAKLGGQLPSYYATKSELDTTNTNLSNLSTTVGTIAGNLSNLTGRVSTAEEIIKGHTSSISEAVADIAANAKNISTNATNITTVANRVKTLEDLGFILKDGYIYTEKTIVSKGEIISGRRASGASTDVGGGGISSITAQMIADALGYVPYSSANPAGYINSSALNGYAKLTDIPSLNGYATEQYVTSRGYITGITSAMVTSALGYTPYNSANFTKATIKSTLGIADWVLAASKPSYAFNEITDKPTTLSGYGITDALPLSGGTIKGDLYLDYSLEKYSRIYFIDRRIGSGGYADEILIIRNGAGVNQGAIGLYGNANGVSYYYFGHNAYNGNNLRIYSDKVSFGDNTLYHTGNFNPANYLPLSGGTITSESVSLRLNRTNNVYTTIEYQKDGAVLGYLGFAQDGNGIISPNRATQSNYYYLIHSGNIGSYNAGSANYLSKSYANEDVNYAKGSGVKMIYSQVSGTNAPIYTSGLSVSTDYSGWQLVAYANPTEKPNPFFRTIDSSNSYPTGWKQLAFLTDNVASATKLQDNTAYTAWGQTFFENGKPKNVSGNLHLNQSKIYWHSDANNYYIGSYYDGTTNPILDIKYYGGIRFFTSAAERMRIATNGNILVGTTTDSGYKLYVSGTGYFGEKLSVNGGVSITAGNLDLGKNEISNAKAIHCYDSGIGYYVGGRNYGLGATDGGTLIYSYGVTPISFYTNTSERMKITGGGNVLIGTTTDSGYKVDINGKTRISGIQLVLGNDNGGQILFQRPSANYIWAYKAGGYLAFGCLDQGTVSLATSSLVVSKGAVYAGATTSLGTSTYKWSKIYGVDIYAEGGWLRTSADNTGLYNSTGDARWYYNVSAGSWVSDKALKIGGNIVLTDRTGSSTTSNRLIFTRSTHDDDYWDFGLYAQSTKGLTFFQSSKGVDTDIAYLTGNGDLVAIGEVISSRRASSSDRRLKNNITYLDTADCLAMVRHIRPAEWDWKDDGKHSMGFIAQDVEHLMPYAVTSIKDDILGQKLNLQYDQFIALAIGGVKAVDNEVDRLKARVEYLENKIKEYEYGNYRN